MTGTVQSNAATASSHATSITNNYQAITGIGEATKDTVSTFSGNTSAHLVITQENTCAQTAASKAVDFVQVLNGMAQEFQTADSQIATAIDSNKGQHVTNSDTGRPDLSLFSEGGDQR